MRIFILGVRFTRDVNQWFSSNWLKVLSSNSVLVVLLRVNDDGFEEISI